MNVPGVRSLRARILILVLGSVVAPLAVAGMWFGHVVARTDGNIIVQASDAIVAFLIVVVFATTAAIVFSRRISRSLVDLANATDAVAAGDLDRRVVTHSNDEVNRVGRAFNTMTESLRATLKQLSQREALVAVGEFAATLAHEVRNPLTSIRVDLQRVEERLPADSDLRTPLARALREVQRLDGTVSGALRIARSGNVALEPVDVRIPLDRAVEVSAAAFERSGAREIGVECDAEPFMVRGDEAALEQVFLNLLLNAAQALGPGGLAGVRMHSDGRFVVVDVWDTGAGIAADRLASVFDPFYSTRPDGTGLGLAIARQVVLAHGGTITIDSQEDAGTTVSISLPAA